MSISHFTAGLLKQHLTSSSADPTDYTEKQAMEDARTLNAGKVPTRYQLQDSDKEMDYYFITGTKKNLKDGAKIAWFVDFYKQDSPDSAARQGDVIHTRQIFTCHGQLSQPDLIVYSKKGERKAVQRQSPYMFFELDDLGYKRQKLLCAHQSINE